MLPIIQIAESTSFLLILLVLGMVVQQIILLLAGVWLYKQWEELRQANARAEKSAERAHQAHTGMLHSMNQYHTSLMQSQEEVRDVLNRFTLYGSRSGMQGKK